ncbi:flavin reductase [Rathayibacter oskolensis]|uniref:flavin reductase family protein n=1 Tax=Rathayibacter oskolensis TaxID=1891671 RepID=UPI00265F0C87|nr:flavin reductase [Rathayibacter oskolensis]WKK72400.1 flavin reductase [Rathayibacter oskolensis]
MYLADDTGSPHDFTWMVKNAVVPRPIAWVGTESADGVGNLAPFSYFTLVTMDPPTLMISFTGEKDSHDNIRATGEFVVNLVTDGQAEVETATAAITPPSLDEAALLGLEVVDSTRVRPKRLAIAKVALECVLLRETEVYDAHVVFAQVLAVHADDGILDPSGRIDIAKYRPVARLGGSLYTTVTSDYKHPVPVATGGVARRAARRRSRRTGRPRRARGRRRLVPRAGGRRGLRTGRGRGWSRSRRTRRAGMRWSSGEPPASAGGRRPSTAGELEPPRSAVLLDCLACVSGGLQPADCQPLAAGRWPPPAGRWPPPAGRVAPQGRIETHPRQQASPPTPSLRVADLARCAAYSISEPKSRRPPLRGPPTFPPALPAARCLLPAACWSSSPAGAYRDPPASAGQPTDPPR